MEVECMEQDIVLDNMPVEYKEVGNSMVVDCKAEVVDSRVVGSMVVDKEVAGEEAATAVVEC